MSARPLLMSVALLSGCASTAAQPEAPSYARGCAREAVFVPNMDALYEDDEGHAVPIGDGCLPCSHAIGFLYPSGTIYLVDPDGRLVELERVEGASADPPYRVLGLRSVERVPLPKRRKMLEALLRGGPSPRAEYEGRLAALTKPAPPPKAPSSAAFVPDRDYPLIVGRAALQQIVIGVRYEAHRDGALVDAMVYVIDPTGQLVQFRLVEASEHGMCNPVERFAEIGVVAWEAVEPAERALSLRKTLVARPTPEEYAAFVTQLTHPVTTLMVSMAEGDTER